MSRPGQRSPEAGTGFSAREYCMKRKPLMQRLLSALARQIANISQVSRGLRPVAAPAGRHYGLLSCSDPFGLGLIVCAALRTPKRVLKGVASSVLNRGDAVILAQIGSRVLGIIRGQAAKYQRGLLAPKARTARGFGAANHHQLLQLCAICIRRLHRLNRTAASGRATSGVSSNHVGVLAGRDDLGSAHAGRQHSGDHDHCGSHIGASLGFIPETRSKSTAVALSRSVLVVGGVQ